MSEPLPTIAYTRNGFVGPSTVIQKSLYPVEYQSAEGSYFPRRFDLDALSSDLFDDVRPLPVTVLSEAASTRLGIEAFNLKIDMPFALRNVFADELHMVYSGEAVFETELGQLGAGPDDLILIPRAISYRIVAVRGSYKSMIVASETPFSLAMTPGRGVLQRIHMPVAQDDVRRPGRYEMVLRHGRETTSVFYDGDPIPGRQVAGQNPLYKINMNEVGNFELVGGVGMVPPGALFHDETTCNLIFNLSSRKTRRPGVHYNADYDELAFFLGGAGSWGALSTPGMLTHTPKGFPHQGPEEEVEAGYKAILIETRCRLQPSAIGASLGQMVVADQYDLHQSEFVAS
jgi:homogentisate 1,2-dioxygenase